MMTSVRWAAVTFNLGVAAVAFFKGIWVLGVLFLLIGLMFLGVALWHLVEGD